MCQAIYQTLPIHRLIAFSQQSDEVIYNYSVLQTRIRSLHIFCDYPKSHWTVLFWHVVASSMLCLLFIYLNEKYRAFIRYFVQSRYMRSSKDQMVQKFIKVYFFKKNIFLWLSQVLVAMWDLVPWPGMEPGPHALGVLSLSHWTIVKSLKTFFKKRELQSI